MTIEDDATRIADEEAIRQLIANWSDALERRDLDAMFADYAEDAVLYDACPPYKTEGAAGIRAVWAKCLPYFPDAFQSEHRDLVVNVSGDLALVYGIHHFVPTPPDHPCGQTWARVTVGYRRIEGKWRVIHEHASMPFNPMTGEVWYIADPDTLDMPDYSAGCSD